MQISLHNILPKNFYEAPSPEVAKKLLGKYLVRKIDDQYIIGKIVEVEAYLPANDPAAHNFTGKSERNKSLFGHAGYTYVHSSRHHHLIDIVTDSESIPGSVLIRALEPVEGIDLMRKFRSTDDITQLTNGPAKLCQAMDIKRNMDGLDITSTDSNLFILGNDDISPENIISTPRIGITKAADLELRFYIKGSEFVSRR